MSNKTYNWKRFWCPRDGKFSLSDGGFLVDPESEYGRAFHPDVLPFDLISNNNCLVLLGEPGIGKSVTIKNEVSVINSKIDEKQLIEIDLRQFSSEDRLVNNLFHNQKIVEWLNNNYELHVFLDSLDEGLLNIRTVAAILSEGFKKLKLGKNRLFLRIACRTADWPLSLEKSLNEIFERSFGIFELIPLRKIDVEEAAKKSDINPEDFLSEVDRMETAPLANKPVTLNFLLDIFKKDNCFPSDKVELYKQGCRILCEENNLGRRDAKHTGSLNPDQRMIIAARVAAITIFSNRFAIWRGTGSDDIPKEDVPIKEIYGSFEKVKGKDIYIDEVEINETISTGLFSSRGAKRMGWAHQTYAEFLAAWYLTKHDMDLKQKINLITHPGDPDNKLVPQLHETAAWLASMDDEILAHIIKVEPDVLLKSDVANKSVEVRKSLLESLLNLYDKQEQAHDHWDLYSYYHKLDYPGISEQLRPFIIDPTKNVTVRAFAIDIATTCKVEDLQSDLVEIALNKSENHQIRHDAAFAIKVFGNNKNKEKLRPLIYCGIDEDPNDGLKGIALSALWPIKLISTKEFFDILTIPKQENFIGIYRTFLSQEFSEYLPEEDIPLALGWVKIQKSRHELPYAMGDFLSSIMFKAWEHIENPDILKSFAEAALSRLKFYDGILDDRHHTQDKTLMDNFERRKDLIITMIPLLKKVGDCFFLSQISFFDDIPWMIERLQLETDDKRKEIWSELIFRNFYPADFETINLILQICNKKPILYEKFKDYIEAVELDSSKAKEIKKRHEQINRVRNKEKKLLDPPPKERIRLLLEKCVAGDLKRWHDLVLNMTLEIDSDRYGSAWETDLTMLPGWKNADKETKDRIVRIATEYVTKEKPETKSWLGENSYPRSVFSNFAALRLLSDFDLINSVPIERWKFWAPFLVDYPIFGEEKYRMYYDKFIKLAYANAPDEIIKTLDFLLKKQKNGNVIEKLESCWDKRLQNFLFEKLKDKYTNPECMGNILRKLLEHQVGEAKKFAESIIPENPSPLSAVENEKAFVAASMLMEYTSDSDWEFIWPITQKKVDFVKKLLLHVEGRFTNHLALKINEKQLADLFIWLEVNFPYSQISSNWPDDWVGDITEDKRLYELKNKFISSLRDRGTPQACKAIQKIKDKFPGLDWLKRTLFKAKKLTRRNTWNPVLPNEILDIVNNCKFRLVQNADQLLDVVIESIERLELKLHDEIPAVVDLWNKVKNKWTPKDENHLSDYVKRHLDDDLRSKGIIINREVQIRRNMGGENKGENTDIHVDVILMNSNNDPEHLKVIIETKGCWHKELSTAMESQLVNRYLKNNQCQHGLYLVGWFNCKQWDENDYRKKVASEMSLEEARVSFNKQAEKLSTDDRKIKSFVLNTALR